MQPVSEILYQEIIFILYLDFFLKCVVSLAGTETQVHGSGRESGVPRLMAPGPFHSRNCPCRLPFENQGFPVPLTLWTHCTFVMPPTLSWEIPLGHLCVHLFWCPHLASRNKRPGTKEC